MAKLGIMGGTFNPIHNGHLIIARIALEAVGLDRVLFLPDGEPPHKSGSQLASGVSRYNMTILAVHGEKGFYPSDMEIKRQGTTYTIDTLIEIKNAYPDDEIYYIVGGDTLYNVDKWSRPQLLSGLCRLVAVPRPGTGRDALLRQAALLKDTLKLEVHVAEQSGPDISSTAIRELATKGQSLSNLVPQSVSDYIAQHGLYGAPPHWIVRQLRDTLSENRLRHTLCVAETAVGLAERFGVDPVQAHLAGMLHDCAKGLDAPSLLRLIRTGGISADETELGMPALLHAPAGEALAKSQYHVTDSAVLSAIRWHTTGRKNMTQLEKIVYLADMIEPERKDFNGLSELRALAEVDLDKAVRMAAALSMAYVTERSKELHPRTVELARETHE